MRYFEVSSGIRITISEEEQMLLSLVEDRPICASDLDLGQGHVATEMVKRGLFLEIENEGEIYYDADRMDLWRI